MLALNPALYFSSLSMWKSTLFQEAFCFFLGGELCRVSKPLTLRESCIQRISPTFRDDGFFPRHAHGIPRGHDGSVTHTTELFKDTSRVKFFSSFFGEISYLSKDSSVFSSWSHSCVWYEPRHFYVNSTQWTYEQRLCLFLQSVNYHATHERS